MKQKSLTTLLKAALLLLVISSPLAVNGQELIHCDTNIVTGQNLVFNPSFELGDVGFTQHSGYQSYNECVELTGEKCAEWSSPGTYWVHDTPFDFNANFSGTASDGDLMLLVDAQCLGAGENDVIWEQTITIASNTRYFFSVDIATILDNSPAELRFEINGEVLPEIITAPANEGQWISYVDSSWYSGNVEGDITIRIINQETQGCLNGVDVALDNIIFTAGCFFGEDGEIPELGDDLNICGTTGELTLEPDVIGGTNIYEYLWSTGDTTSSITIDEAGTYAVCMTTNGSCIKSDLIRIAEDFSVNIGGDNAVCREISDTLVADHSGPLVSYQWFKDGIAIDGATDSVYIPTQLGSYSVMVTDDAGEECGPEFDAMVLSQGELSIDLGTDIELCSPTVATLNAGYDGVGYEWFFEGERIGTANTQVIEVNEVGTYSVIVYDALCDPVQDDIEVSSLTFNPINGLICPEDPGTDSTVLSIAGYSGDTTNYVWYTDSIGGTELYTGVNYQTPGLTETTTYWVEDQSTFSGSVGPVDQLPCSGGWGSTDPQKQLVIEVNNELVIDSILVYPMHNNVNFVIGIRIYDMSDNLVNSVLHSPNLPGLAGNDALAYPTYVPVNITLPPGQYKLTAEGTNDGTLYFNQSCWTPTFPYTEVTGSLSIIDNLENGQSVANGEAWTPQLWTAFYDIRFSSGAVCDRVPVQAVYDPIECNDCTIPTQAIVDSTTSTQLCFGDSVQIVANLLPDSAFIITWFHDGAELTQTDDTIWVSEPGEYTFTVADPANPEFCSANATNSIEITVQAPPFGTIEISGDELSLCPGIEQTFTASSPDGTIRSFEWYVDDVLQAEDGDTITRDFTVATEIKVVTVLEDVVCVDTVVASDSSTISITTLPTYFVEAPDSIIVCPDDEFEISVSASPESNIVSYTWNNDGTETQTTEGTFTSTVSDTTVIYVTANFSGLECLDTASATDSTIIVTQDALEPTIGISSSGTDFCDSQLPLSFTATDPQNGGLTPTYLWYIQGVLVAGENGAIITTSDINDGDSVYVGMISSLGCVSQDTVFSEALNITITETTPVTLEISVDDTEACEGQTLTYTATPSGTGIIQWYVAGSLEQTGTELEFTWTASSSTDTVHAVFLPDVECPDQTAVSSDNIFVEVTPVTVEISAINNGEFCDGLENGYAVSNMTNGGDTPGYEWFVNGTTTGVTDSIYSSDDLEEGDLVQVVLTSSDANCPNPDTASATVSALETPGTPSVFISASTDICDGDTWTAVAIPGNAGSTYELTWYLNGTALTEDSTYIELDGIIDGDSLGVEIKSSLYCVTDSMASGGSTVSVHVNPISEAGDDQIFDDFEEVTLDGTGSTETGVTYAWTSSDTTNEITNANLMTGALVTPNETESTFYLTVANDFCSSLDSMMVFINLDLDDNFPNAFSPNGDGENDVFEIDNLDQFPGFRLEIYNRWGSLLYVQDTPTAFWDGKNNGKEMPVATYYFIFTYAEGETGEFIKKGHLTLIR